jgi:hypothetical protein
VIAPLPSEQDAAITNQTEPYATPPTYTQPPARKSRRVLWIAISVAAALLLLVGAILYAAGTLTGGGLSKASAERACRTAFGSEWQKRSNVAGSGTATSIVASVKEIEMLETVKEGDGYTVNGTVHYTLTTALIAPVEGSIDLTCTATGSDDAPATEVTNRS